MSDDMRSLALSNRVVLLSLTQLSLEEETPAHTGQVIRACTEHVESVEADTIGKVAEAEVNRALNNLEAENYVEMDNIDEASPIGKGRPAYRLRVDVDTVLDELNDDDQVGPLAQQVADHRD
jgi:predicted transcriptional regulator